MEAYWKRYAFINYTGNIPTEERKYMPIPPKTVKLKNVVRYSGEAEIMLCRAPGLMVQTKYN